MQARKHAKNKEVNSVRVYFDDMCFFVCFRSEKILHVWRKV